MYVTILQVKHNLNTYLSETTLGTNHELPAYIFAFCFSSKDKRGDEACAQNRGEIEAHHDGVGFMWYTTSSVELVAVELRVRSE